ncbi:MAG: GUN4 domain-containing protein, partial [Cylindrospermopsis raciborskii PAMP2012]
QGLLMHYQDPNPHNRIQIIPQALNYGNQGINFLIGVLKNDDSLEVQSVAYKLILSKDKQLAKTLGSSPAMFLTLQSLLQSQNFKEADRETATLVLAVANRQAEGYLRKVDAENFPRRELHTVDQLWLKYSGYRFGMSIQYQVYKSLIKKEQDDDGFWCSFAEKVGWKQVGKKWLYYDQLNFSLSAPVGHLPWGGFGWFELGGGGGVLFSLLSGFLQSTI